MGRFLLVAGLVVMICAMCMSGGVFAIMTGALIFGGGMLIELGMDHDA